MKTYQLMQLPPSLGRWTFSLSTPNTFTDLEEASTEMVRRIFDNGFQYKIVESEEQQS